MRHPAKYIVTGLEFYLFTMGALVIGMAVMYFLTPCHV